MCRYETTKSVYMSHISSLKAIMWPEDWYTLHFTLLLHAPKQICLLICKYFTQQCYCSLHIDPTLLYISVNTTKCNINLPCYSYICASSTYAPQMSHTCHIPKIEAINRWCGSSSSQDHHYRPLLRPPTPSCTPRTPLLDSQPHFCIPLTPLPDRMMDNSYPSQTDRWTTHTPPRPTQRDRWTIQTPPRSSPNKQMDNSYPSQTPPRTDRRITYPSSGTLSQAAN